MDKNFDDLRPYRDNEISAAVHRIAENPLFDKVMQFLYPGGNLAVLKEKFLQINTIVDFQYQVMHYAINLIAKKTMTSFSYSGLEELDRSKRYLFISNHRDIVLDSALLQVALHDTGHRTSEITFGSNLMQGQFVIDIGKSNKMFKVERGGTPREFYRNSLILSHYIRHTLIDKMESIWIAQRNGRSKDGNDLTDQGIIKMFSMSSDKNIAENLAELNITPMAVSYQWEVCDVEKVNEIYISRREKYIKKPGEDLQSIINGFLQFKGKVHITVTQPLTIEELNERAALEKNDVTAGIASLINERIFKAYKLSSTNYIAYDILGNNESHIEKQYTRSEKDFFISEMDRKLSALNGDLSELKDIYLGIYANPVVNYLKSI